MGVSINIGFGIKFEITKYIFMLFDFKEYIGLTPYGYYAKTAQAGSIITGYESYNAFFSNSTLGIGFIIPQK